MNEQTQPGSSPVERPVRPTLPTDEARRCADIVHWFLMGRYPANIGDGLYKDLLDLVRLTRSAERERCARLCGAEHVLERLDAEVGHPCDLAYNRALLDAAYAIRKA